jgi:hypothetical protein
MDGEALWYPKTCLQLGEIVVRRSQEHDHQQAAQ